jgi:trans-AT polyketide synthase/acyltransferase/oxidoreductase domain-containing protein
MVAFVFPGQGSQSKGMGGTLFDEFKELTAQADQILGYSIKELCLQDPNLNLSQTRYTQPALYIVNALSYLNRIKETGKKPDFTAGHSLGEYNALFAAGVFDFETGCRLVKMRGELMSRATGGGMAAVIGLNEEQVAAVLQQNNWPNINIANLNSPFQIVISGPKADIDQAGTVFAGIPEVKMFAPLKASGAFHSRYMEAARREFEVFLGRFKFSELQIPVIANVHARPYQSSDIYRNLCDQITHPVRWTETIQYLMGLGEMEFEEIGTGKILTGLIGRIRKEVPPLVISPETAASVINERQLPVNVIENIKNPVISESATNQHSKLNVVPEAIATITKAIRVSKDRPKNKSQEKIKPAPKTAAGISASSLGNSEFKKDYNLKYAYLTGGMYRGIASPEMVVKMGKAGMMGFFGSGGLEISQIEAAIQYIQKELSAGQAYGINMVYNPNAPESEAKIIDLLLAYGVTRIEAAAFLSITPALVKYRARGLKRDPAGQVISANRIIAKVSRPEVAEVFLSPAPERMIARLAAENEISPEAADLAKEIPMADDICAEADSGGHTDGGVAYALMPAMLKLRDEMLQKYRYHKKVRVGAAGGIGTPEAAAAAFILGADFILTGSINQCTVEAATSNSVKDLLQQINVQDTEYAPAGDMFELGAKVQVLKRGLFFPARANKLYDLYRQYNSLDEMDEKTRSQIQEKYFKRSFEEVYRKVKSDYPAPEIARVERDPKAKMALIFKWYFDYSTQLALSGNEECQVDYQVPCGPALGAFNQWVKGTIIENWRNRHVDEIAVKLMNETAEVLNQRYNSFLGA